MSDVNAAASTGNNVEVYRAELVAEDKSFIDTFAKAAEAAKNLGWAVASTIQHFNVLDAGVKRVGRGMFHFGLGITAANFASAASAASLQKSMLNVMTVADASKGSLNRMTDAVVEMSTTVPQSAKDLSTALYDIVSTGYQGEDALNVLNTSATAASAGLTDTSVAARGLTAILQSYGKSADQATYVSDLMFQTVNLGVVNFQELSNTVGDWAATAAQAGVSMEQATSALAAMTLAGTNANEASTQLQRLMLSFIDPTDQMTTAFQRMGYSSASAALRSLGLKDALGLLWQQAHSDTTTMQTYFGRIEAFNGALQLVGKNAGNYGRVFGQLTDRMSVAGSTQRALAIQSQGLAFQLDMLKNKTMALGSTFGRFMVPAVTMVVTSLNNMVEGAGMALDMLDMIGRGAMRFVGTIMQVASMPFSWTGIFWEKNPLEGIDKPVTGFITAMHVALGLVSMMLGKFIALKGVQAFTAIGRALDNLLPALRKVFADNRIVQWIGHVNDSIRRMISSSQLANSRMGQMAKSFSEHFRGMGGFAYYAAGALGAFAATTLYTAGILADASRQAKDFAKSIMQLEKTNDLQSFNDALEQGRRALEAQQDMTRKGFFGRVLDVGQMFVETVNPVGDNKTLQHYKNQIALREQINLTAEQMTTYQANLDRITKQQQLWAASSIMAGIPLEQLNQALMAVIQSMSYSPTGDIYELLFKGQVPGIPQNIEALEKYRSTVKAVTPELMQAAIQAAGIKIDLTKGYLTSDEQKQVGDAVTAYIKQQRTVRTQQQLVNDAVRTFGDITKSTEDRVAAMAAAMEGLTGATLTWSNIVAGAGTSLRSLGDTFREILKYRGGLEDMFNPQTEAGAMFSKSMSDAVDEMIKGAQEVYTRTQSAGKVQEYVSHWSDMFIQIAQAAGLPVEYIDKIRNSLLNLPTVVSVLMKTQGADEALKTALGLANVLFGIDGKTFTYQLIENRPPRNRLPREDQADFGYGEPSTNINVTALQDAQTVKNQLESKAVQDEQRYQDALYAAGKIGYEQYVKLLDARKDKYKEDTVEYQDALKKKEDVQKAHDERMYQQGLISYEQYRALERKRMADMDKNSEQYADAQQKAKSEEQARLESIAKTTGNKDALKRFLLNQVNTLEKFTPAWMEAWSSLQDLADEDKRRFDSFKDPIIEATDALKNLSKQGKITVGDFQAYFKYMVRSATEWNTTVVQLKRMGLNPKMIENLMQMGPEGLNFARQIVKGGAPAISTINSGMAQIEASGMATAAWGMQNVPISQPANVLQFTMDGTQITVSINAPAQVTAKDVDAALDKAFGALAKQVETKVTSGYHRSGRKAI